MLAPMIPEEQQRVRALCLLSGGLDSQLAVCVLRAQGIDVHGVVFDSPFFNPQVARDAAAQLEIPLHIVNFSPEIVALLENPPHGFGSCMNPCIDCHALMLRRAGEMLEDRGFHFLVTGEVLDERPMSQNRGSLNVVARDSGYADLILRPLSAGLLPPTRPELEGWVDRARLLSIRGRGRKQQLRLAQVYGLIDFPSPAGGCRLTEPGFCRRLQDLKDHEGLHGVNSITRLRYGRHFRLADEVKVIVGRHESDNAFLEGNVELYDLVLKVDGPPGPTALMPFTAADDLVRLGASICARYCDSPRGSLVRVKVKSARDLRNVDVLPADEATIERLRV